MSRAEQRHAISRLEGGEAVVQKGSSLDLLSVRRTTGESLGVTSRELVIEIVLHGLLSDRETHGNRLVVVTSRVSLLRVVISNSLTFLLNRSRAKARQLDFLFESLFGVFGLIDEGMLIFVLLILQTKQGVKPRQEFLEHLCA